MTGLKLTTSLGGLHGSSTGLATYFAEVFSNADLHAGPYCFKRFKSHCHVLVVAVLMGRGFEMLQCYIGEANAMIHPTKMSLAVISCDYLFGYYQPSVIF